MTNNSSNLIKKYVSVFGVGSLIETAGTITMELTNYSSVMGASLLVAGTFLMSTAVGYMGYNGQKILNKKESEMRKESSLEKKV